jgi:DNA topoisomerase 2-associated protein PAT1
MSFFGFDTSLPREKAQKASDPFDPTDGDDDAAFEEKLRGLKAGAQEDVEIYTWGGGGEGGYDGLGDLLDEAGDDLNDDTFGFSSAKMGKDFDFGGTGGGANTTSATKVGKSSKTNDAAFASTLDDFWSFPGATPAVAPSSAPANAWNQQSAPTYKTLEEIEAELKANGRQQQHQPAPTPLPNTSSDPHRPLTLEEVEAEMLAKRSQQISSPPSSDSSRNACPLTTDDKQQPGSASCHTV